MSWSTGCGRKWIRRKHDCRPFAGSAMSSNPPCLRRSFVVRLSLRCALIFVISTSALLVLVYYLVALEFQGKDKEIILAKLNEYAAVYQAGGANALTSFASRENNPSA